MTEGGRHSSEGASWPIRVMVVDAERPPELIEATRPAGGVYRSLWVLVRLGGQPRALVKLDLPPDGITAQALAPQLRDALAGTPPPDPIRLPNPAPMISVVISSMFERESELHACLESISALDYPSFEVLLVDNRRTEHQPVPAWLAELPRVRLLAERRPGLAAGRNRGLRDALGEIVVFTDDDVVVDPGWLTAYARRFAEHPEESAVSGLILPNGIETAAQVRIEEYYGGYGRRLFQPLSHRLERPDHRRGVRRPTVVAIDDDGRVVQRFSLYEGGKLGSGANLAFRTAVMRSIGGFDMRLGVGTPGRSGEDLEVLARLAWRGHAVGFEPAAFLLHSDRDDDAALQHKLIHYGCGFTAVLAALIADDVRHAGALLCTLPVGAGRLSRYFLRRVAGGSSAGGEEGGEDVASVSRLARLEMRGMIAGPGAFLRSARQARRDYS